MALGRRNFLFLLGATTGAGVLGFPPVSASHATESIIKQAGTLQAFQLDSLPYAYNALEPYIDEATMRFHHDNHYATYIKNLNEAVNKYPQLKLKKAEALLRNIKNLPEDIRMKVRNNGGGYVNHKMFWEIMGPNAGGPPTGPIASAINAAYGSFEIFKQQFNEAGINRFGSGWVWLVHDQYGKLQIMSTANQDSPFIMGTYPILGNDVWEHAYYLKYQFRRPDYLKAWWNVINWGEVNKRYKQAIAMADSGEDNKFSV